MGRIFETRKATMFARWDKMAKAFTRVGKEIVIAVKSGGPDPAGNATLRRAIQNAKSVNMPKDRIDAAIKRAMGKDMEDYSEILYEGYGPHGVPILVEAATDNPTRTVGNLRPAFSKLGGNLGNSGSVSFQFTKKGVFKLKFEDVTNPDELELELIDAGLDDMGESVEENGDKIWVLHCEFNEFGNLQKGLEDKGIETISSEMEWIPQTLISLSEEQTEEVLKLVDKLEQDEDVQKVFHNLQ
ncbi:MAG: YebC/PmpR family DNA-binding transcriptional regulator [Bacteroidetes bacterium]|nr:YebC/PmpR family DNA-binding transcriptional regulator [Bacteroidota bacterium]